MQNLLTSNVTFTKARNSGKTYTKEVYEKITTALYNTKNEKLKSLLILIMLDVGYRAGTLLIIRVFIRNKYSSLATILIPFHARLVKSRLVDVHILNTAKKIWFGMRSFNEDKIIIREILQSAYPDDYKRRFKFL